MNNFPMIPIEIFRSIQQYLKKKEYRNLLNTNKEIFKNLRYETVYYDIFIPMKSVNNEQLQSFSSVVGESVKDKSKQISVYMSSPAMTAHYASLISGIHKLKVFNGSNNLSVWSNNPNMNLYCNIYSVFLGYIEGIDCLSGLTHIKILEIFQSNSLVTIDFIPGLKRLKLNHLSKLLEISQYGNIPELEIKCCYQLSLKGLGNHQRCIINGIHSLILDDVLRLKNIQCLNLSYHRVSEIWDNFPIFINLIYLIFNGISIEEFDCSYFPNLRFLQISHTNIPSNLIFPSSLKFGKFVNCYFSDLSVVKDVKELVFEECRGEGFSNGNVLSNAYKITFDKIEELDDVSGLGRVYYLNIDHCRKVRDISKLGRVHRLGVEQCQIISLEGLGEGNSDILCSKLPMILSFAPLQSIYKVTLKCCEGLVDGRDLINVQHLTILDCDNFEDTSDLGKVKSLYLVQCHKVKRIVGLENVPHIHLEGCDRLEDIDCLGKQQSLTINNCEILYKLGENDVIKKYEEMFRGIPLVKIDDISFSVYSTEKSRNLRMPDIFHDELIT